MARRSLAQRSAPVASEPDLAPEFKRVVRRAVRWGWSEVGSRWPEIMATGREEEITQKLQFVLNELDPQYHRCAPGLELFEAINRGIKVETADGRIEKAPDLVFRPLDRRGVRNLSDWGLFVECKVVDKDVAHHTADKYCTGGVARYVMGEYAARMPSGMMLGFVRDTSAPHQTLQPLLNSTYKTTSHTAGETSDESVSIHDRAECGCTAISLVHYWLQEIVPGALARGL